MSNVNFKRAELQDMLSEYTLISDCIRGEKVVKSKGDLYLPRPNSSDTSTENSARYESYKKRAKFYNITYRTQEDLVGEIFMRDPEISLPTGLFGMEKNCNGEGVSMVQVSKAACSDVLAFGRIGMLADFPAVDRKLTRADINSGRYIPKILTYKPWQVINWRTQVVNGETLLKLVVIEETIDEEVDDFRVETITQWRVLRMGKSPENEIEGVVDNPNFYTVEIWRDQETINKLSELKGDKFKPLIVPPNITRTKDNYGGGGTGDMVVSSYQPKNSSGQNLNYIPFEFVGSKNNDSSIDKPPLYDIASLNIGHYRNSADYEEASFICGQPTVYVSGLTSQWWNDILKQRLTLGSRGGIPLPKDSTAGILQAEANSMPKEAMDQKEDQCVAIGAKLIMPNNVEQTATEVNIDRAAETSTLASIVKNVNEGFNDALSWCADFTGDVVSEEQMFTLNDDFKMSNMSAEDRRQLREDYSGGVISWSEARENLRRSNVTFQKDAVARSEIESDLQKKQEREVDQAGKMAEATAKTEKTNTSEN